MSRNISVALGTVEFLLQIGVRKAIICAGSFNSPMVAALKEFEEIELFYHFEERASSFFALGLSKNLAQPVAVCCTSGTAVAECLPAIIEAFYSDVPLVIISADREAKLAGTGYPQAIKQGNLLIEYCQSVYDISSLELDPFRSLLLGNKVKQPLHINIRFTEPILDNASINSPINKSTLGIIAKTVDNQHYSKINITEILNKFSKPIVLVGKLDPTQQTVVADFIFNNRLPALIEASSGIRESRLLKDQSIKSGEKLLCRQDFDCVLRFGDVPNFDIWRELERLPDYQNIAVYSFSSRPGIRGLARPSHSFHIEEINFDYKLSTLNFDWIDKLFEKDRRCRTVLESLLEEYPRSEAAFIRKISCSIVKNSYLYLGNSLPIREWNEFAVYQECPITFDANRGANGIDGQLASFFGGALANKAQENAAILGDLTFLYDLNSLTLQPQLQDINFSLFVINNKGGRIFERLPYFEKLNPDSLSKEKFLNHHNYSCARLASAFGITSRSVEDPESIINFFGKQLVLELLPDANQTQQFNADLTNAF